MRSHSPADGPHSTKIGDVSRCDTSPLAPALSLCVVAADEHPVDEFEDFDGIENAH